MANGDDSSNLSGTVNPTPEQADMIKQYANLLAKGALTTNSGMMTSPWQAVAKGVQGGLGALAAQKYGSLPQQARQNAAGQVYDTLQSQPYAQTNQSGITGNGVAPGAPTPAPAAVPNVPPVSSPQLNPNILSATPPQYLGNTMGALSGWGGGS
jgi:hypothetical protein